MNGCKMKTLFALSTISLLMILSACQIEKNKLETQKISDKNISIKETTPKDTINWICIWSNRKSKRQFIEDVCQEYMFLNQDQHINLRFDKEVDPTYNRLPAMAESLAVQINEGRCNEDIVIHGWSYYIYDRVSNNPNWVADNLVDFENIPGYKESLAEGIYGNELYTLNTKGQYIGPFIEGQLSCLFYNKELADKIGLEIPQFNLTIDEFLEYMQAVKRYNEQTGSSINFIIIERMEFFNFLFSTALNYNPADKANYTLSQKKEALLTALNLLQKIGSANITHSNVAADFLHYDNYLFADGETWTYNKYVAQDSLKSRRIVPIEFPSINKPFVYSGGYEMHFGVLKNSPQKENAINLLMYLASTDNAENWVQTTKNPTGMKRHFKADGVSSDYFDIFITHIQEKYKGNIGNIFVREVFNHDNIISIDYKSVYNGTKSPEEVFDEIMAQLEG